jgi:hypothetical protein
LKGQEQSRGDVKEGGRQAVNPLQKRMDTVRKDGDGNQAEGGEQENKSKQWHTPTEGCIESGKD